MTNVRDAKAVLRTRIRETLASMSRADAAAGSTAVCQHLLGLVDLSRVGRLLSYWPIEGEVDVREFHASWAQRGGTLALPRVNWRTSEIEAAEAVADGSNLVADRHGLRQPGAGARVVPASEITAVIVPGLGFDRRGWRLGRGGGFYDRLLAGIDGHVPRIGVGFDGQVVDELPIESHDARMTLVVTPGGVLRW